MAEYKAVIRVHRPECLICGHLVDFAQERLDSCHISRGNQDCPARVMTIVVGFDRDSLVDQILSAQRASNWTEVASLMARVSALPAEQRQAVTDALTARSSQPAAPPNGPVSGAARPTERAASKPKA